MGARGGRALQDRARRWGALQGGGLLLLSMAPTPGTYAVPASIPADCSADVSQALTSWIASVPDGSTLTFAAGGCYRIESGIDVIDRHGLTFEGNGATFRATTPGDSGRKQWQVIGGSTLTLRNVTAVGVNPAPLYDHAYEWQHNFSIQGSDGVTLDQVTGLNAYGDFVSVDPDRRDPLNGAIPARDIVVRNSMFRVSGRQGVSCTFCEGLTVERNTFEDVGQSVVDWEIEDAAWHGHDLRVRDNTIGRTHFGFVMSWGPGRDIRNITVTGNVMREFPDLCVPPILLVAPPDSRVTNVVVEYNDLKTYNAGIYTAGVEGLSVERNTSSHREFGCGDRAGVHVADSRNGSVVGNWFPGADPAFLPEPDSNGFTLCGNSTDQKPSTGTLTSCGATPPLLW